MGRMRVIFSQRMMRGPAEGRRAGLFVVERRVRVGAEVRSTRSPARGGTTANASAMAEEPPSSEDGEHVCAEGRIQEQQVCRLVKRHKGFGCRWLNEWAE